MVNTRSKSTPLIGKDVLDRVTKRTRQPRASAAAPAGPILAPIKAAVAAAVQAAAQVQQEAPAVQQALDIGQALPEPQDDSTQSSDDSLLDGVQNEEREILSFIQESGETIIAAMINSKGDGVVWDNPLPIHIFLTYWPDLEHPWTDGDSPEVQWLQGACAFTRAGASDLELEKYVEAYEEFKALSVLEGYPLVGPTNLDPGPLVDHLVDLKGQIWDHAVAGAASLADNDEDAASFTQQLTDQRDKGPATRGSPVRFVWELLWGQARTSFSKKEPPGEEQAEFDVLLEEAYRLVEMSERFRFPPRITMEMAPEDVCQSIDELRRQSVDEAVQEWDRGNITNDGSFNQRRDRFLNEIGEDGYTGWGYGPRDEVRWERNIAKSFSKFSARFNAERPPGLALWDEVMKLTYLKARFNMEVLLPHWPLDMPAAGYVVPRAKPAMFEKAIELMTSQWEIAIDQAEAAIGEVDEYQANADQMRTQYDQVLRDARNLTEWPILPDQFRLSFAWDALYERLPQSTDVVARSRIDDLRKDVYEANWRFGDQSILPLPIDDDESLESYTSRLSPHVQEARKAAPFAAWQSLIDRTPVGAEKDGWTARFQVMKQSANRNGRYYRPGQRAAAVPPLPLGGRRLGPGSGRGAPAGTWKFLATAGIGGHGHAGSYLRSNWNKPRMWHRDQNFRVPLEYKIVSDLNALEQSVNVIRYISYGIYERLRMHRIYMELCPHGTLHDLQSRHRNIFTMGQIDAFGNLLESRIPVRAIWCIFEALASALYLLQEGSLPGLPRPAVQATPVIHRDLKPANIFLALPDQTLWRGIPIPKASELPRRSSSITNNPQMGDFGQVIPITSDDLQTLNVGTSGWRAPEHMTYLPTHPHFDHNNPVSVACDIWAIGRIMLALMNRDPTTDITPHPYGSIPIIPPFAPGIEAYYPAELVRLVRACLEMDPADRIRIDVLWRDIHSAVASYVGLSGIPLKARDGDVGEDIRFKGDTYLAFAPDLQGAELNRPYEGSGTPV
ncbi:uncharacterized protein RCC_08029 [Ramularia collo-cygni]|uniref:non-specific serine/threonine protein kinase n=1 Tax=Ramularia collo-cygni TaxID=112498 RepID=A0A2D3V9P1_9PEZI|nr:uncharacterized protein RCC_08029 [Ramularia collo-cygni]CZT22160.1 uncharacterized protein RCC_08029 [Ramularia collo-cygni]